jgi:hypothetical protein
MNAQHESASKRFGGIVPQRTNPQKEQKIKEVLSEAQNRKRANKALDHLLEQFPRKRIIDILPAIKKNFPSIVAVALERVERRTDALSPEDLIFLANFKRELEQ